ncbi:MAG: cupin domain-containing protein [Candidatus Nitrosoabyssus spongiisocia]|nr:MAG: cupin domain-containing protein [Nitrosopumilaceae archaeon AB1(1)]
MNKKIIIPLAIATVVLSLAGFSFITAADEISTTTLLETSKTVIGQDIQYPSGVADITSKIITIPPGVQTGFHTHEYPLFAYIMEGKVSVTYGNESSDTELVTKEFLTGDSFVEAIKYSHNGVNTGDIPVKILIVIMGAN